MLVSLEQISDVFQNVGFAFSSIMLISGAGPIIIIVIFAVVIIVFNVWVTGLIVPWAPAFPPMVALSVSLFAADEAEAHAALTADVITSLAELDASLTMSVRTLLPVFATLKARERLRALFVGVRFA